MPLYRAVAARAERFLVVTSIAGLVVIAFAVAPGVDLFRIAKESVMRLQAIVSAFLLVVAVAYGGSARLRELLRDRAVVAVLAGIVIWTAITTLTSGHRLLSVESLVTVVCSVILFVAIWYIAPQVPAAALLALVPGVVVNTLLAALQEYQIWNPFRFAYEGWDHLNTTGLIGNPNDIGGYLALCAVVLLMASASLEGWLRWISVAAGVIAILGVFVSQTRTAALALVAAAAYVALRRSWKLALAVAAAVLLSLLIATRVDLPVLTRIAQVPSYLARGEWNVVLSDRLPAFAAAVGMVADHPVVGVGPGAYKYFYLAYRIRASEIYPSVIMSGAGVNFAETHNDHLQLLAETGLPGYALFLAACVILVRRSRSALPLVITLAVLALAFFPLQIAVTRHLLITISALLVGWSRT